MFSNGFHHLPAINFFGKRFCFTFNVRMCMSGCTPPTCGFCFMCNTRFIVIKFLVNQFQVTSTWYGKCCKVSKIWKNWEKKRVSLVNEPPRYTKKEDWNWNEMKHSNISRFFYWFYSSGKWLCIPLIHTLSWFPKLFVIALTLQTDRLPFPSKFRHLQVMPNLAFRCLK